MTPELPWNEVRWHWNSGERRGLQRCGLQSRDLQSREWPTRDIVLGWNSGDWAIGGWSSTRANACGGTGAVMVEQATAEAPRRRKEKERKRKEREKDRHVAGREGRAERWGGLLWLAVWHPDWARMDLNYLLITKVPPISDFIIFWPLDIFQTFKISTLTPKSQILLQFKSPKFSLLP